MSVRSLPSPRRSGGILLSAVALPTLLLLALAAPLSAQEPALYEEARGELADGDTLEALSLLRKLTDAEPEFAPGWGLLGMVLTDLAGGVATNYHQRLEADKALRTAWRLDPSNPTYLMALGTLMRKQQMYFDARRVLNRAKESLEKTPPEEILPAERAFLWYELGLHHEDVYLDTHNLVFVPNLIVNSPECGSLGSFCLNFTRPQEFNEQFRYAASLEEEAEDDYEQMTDAFQRALDADPTHAGAFRRLAAHLVDRGFLSEAIDLAQRFQHDAPQNPWGYLTLGLAYYRQGLDSLAQAQFDRGIELAGPDIAEHYLDIHYVLRDDIARKYEGADAETRRWLEDILWRKSDPLYLTPGNEVKVAHLARVSFADLWFEDPSEGRWGADSERGQIYVRYGPPERIWQVQRDASREASVAGGTLAEGGGRWIFWNYAWDLPSFVFEKQLRYRHASHVFSSVSKSFEEEAREVEPAIYSTNFDLVAYPVQIARFRGAADSLVEVDVYAEAPADELLDEPDTLDLGLFLFAGVEFQEVYRRTIQTASEPEPQPITYSLPLLPGTYTYSLEARGPGYKAAVDKGEISAQPYRDGVLALSDLVLADTVVPRVLDNPQNRRAFAIEVNRRRVFDRDLPVAAYWEVYGLATDQEGFANYRVQLSVTDAEGKGVLATIAGAFGFGDDEDIELTYERVVRFNGERVPEYISLKLVDSEPGEYRLRIEVEDLISGARVATDRTFQLVTVE
jgi:GWxTD domain-containing protein